MNAARPARDLTLPMATDIAPADTSDTTVVDPRPEDQIGLRTEPRRYDVAYATVPAPGGERELRLDLVRPPTAERLPLVVFLPGGAFLFANRVNAYARRAFVAESGFVVASAEYRTTGDNATYVDAVQDVRNAVGHLVAHADDYGIDARAVAVWGESAGGYLAAMTAVTTAVRRFATRGPAVRIDAVVDCFGCSDLSTIGADFDEQYQAYYRENVTHFSAYLGAPGRTLPEIPAAVRAADPVTYVNATTPPFLLLHGTGDVLISPSQTQRLHQALLAAGVDSTRYLLRGANHGDVAIGDPEGALPWSSTTTMGIVTDFLHRHLDRP